MNWFEHQTAIAHRQLAAMERDFQHEMYEHNLEEAVRSLIQKLEDRDREIAALRHKIESLTKEEATNG